MSLPGRGSKGGRDGRGVRVETGARERAQGRGGWIANETVLLFHRSDGRDSDS